MRSWYFAPMLPFFLAACGGVDQNETLDAVRLTEQAHHEAMAAHDVDGVARVYADNAAVTVPGGASAEGREAISKAYTALLSDAGMKLDIKAGPGWAAESGELAVTTFTGTLTRTDPVTGAAVVYPVDNQSVWHRANGSSWQIVSERTVTGEQQGAAAEGVSAEAAAE